MSWFDSIAKAVSEAVEIGTRDLQEFVGTVTEDTTTVTQAATQVAASALNAAASAASAAAVVAAAEADRLTSILDTELEEREPSKQVGTIQTSKDSPNNAQIALTTDASTKTVCTNDVDTNTYTSLAATIEQSSTTISSSTSNSLPFSPTKALNAAEIAKERLKKIEAAEEEPLGWGDEES